ncbi:hypothetical protein I3271_09185 [Photobacterium leiognathi]|uniref:hypothetical protein n=1 Tax=Photobacterium leiognathi TaxID=553611 RepID=UPI001EE08CBE|nr:hypothetical protein [Photobacterium leiognathi]MCG3884862.1 hypothetical protein [Photobacterium leiognathi]
MTELKDFAEILLLIKDNIKLVIFAFSLVAFFIFFLMNRDYVESRVKAFWYRLPLIGKNARLSKNLEVDDENGHKWFKSEKNVGNAFYPYFNDYNKNADSYVSATQYLNRAHDNSTTPMGFWHWLFIVVAVLIEASSFAYVIAGFTLTDASNALQIQTAVMIGLVISAILLVLTHKTGYQLAENKIFNKVLDERADYQRRTGIETSLTNLKNSSVSWKTKLNHLDDNKEPFIQLLNRLKDTKSIKPKYGLISGCIITIICIAIAATYIRTTVLDGYINQMIESGEYSTHTPSGSATGDDISLSLFDDGTTERQPPQEVIDTNKAAEDKAYSDQIDAFVRGSWATFGFLGFIFIVLQWLSILISYKAYMNGSESLEAYKVAKKFNSLDEFQSYYREKRDYAESIGQAVLNDLQSKIRERARTSHSGNEMNLVNNMQHRTFRMYIDQKDEANYEFERKTRQKQIDKEEQEQAERHRTDMIRNSSSQHTQSNQSSSGQESEPQSDRNENPRSIDDIIKLIEAADISLLSDKEIMDGYREIEARKNKKIEETPQERLARIRAEMEQN